jgi:hypothetical protein
VLPILALLLATSAAFGQAKPAPVTPSPAAQFQAWVKAGYISDVKQRIIPVIDEETVTALDIEVTRKFVLLPEKTQTQIAATACLAFLSLPDDGYARCFVASAQTTVATIYPTYEGEALVGTEVQWERWYIAEIRRRAFARAK